jgi:alcohol dehydrogenase
MPRSLGECGVERNAVSTLAEEAARQWTATFNPRTVTKEDFAKLYEETFKRRPLPVM